MFFDEKDRFNLNDLSRRLTNIIRVGMVFAIDYQKAQARVKIGELETDWLFWLNANSGNNNSWNPPEIDEQVVILSPSGELNQAVILPSLYKNNASESNPDIQNITYKDGSKISFNHKTGNLDLNITGNVTVKATGNVEIDANNVTLKGNINLGSDSGKAIARVGDMVEIKSGSSAGKWPIVSGSNNVKSA